MRDTNSTRIRNAGNRVFMPHTLLPSVKNEERRITRTWNSTSVLLTRLSLCLIEQTPEMIHRLLQFVSQSLSERIVRVQLGQQLVRVVLQRLSIVDLMNATVSYGP